MSAARAGQVVAAHGRHVVVETDAAQRLTCTTRGRRAGAACGDEVLFEDVAPGQGVIVEFRPRRNLFYRSDAHREKYLAANVDQIAVVVAVWPSFSEELLGRTLVAASAAAVPVTILLNKIDLLEALPAARSRLQFYRTLGYEVEEISVRSDPQATYERLLARLGGGTSMLVGQSGMGKSSLLNLLVPDAHRATREISAALSSGRHTTTDAQLYHLADARGRIIDTPGFQSFGLAHLTKGAIERGFPEFVPLLGHCRFYNCTHLAEPGCAIRNGLAEGTVTPARYELFVTLTRESSAAH